MYVEKTAEWLVTVSETFVLHSFNSNWLLTGTFPPQQQQWKLLLLVEVASKGKYPMQEPSTQELDSKKSKLKSLPLNQGVLLAWTLNWVNVVMDSLHYYEYLRTHFLV